ncbi:ABC transporter permease [Rhodococcus sp. DMU1]|uniref:ABC transporter permease n=1 Tax=Rhodococcus sp. DMU1 TaxID=2722825 RepID=UPI00143E1915|nr:ABC transporter permease [Rhodococcus sp. DMU1]QIX53711.1 ABC transporter permease [Rhodococcus sp. DMU1]
MLALILRRIAALIPVMLLVSFVVFMLSTLIPGDAATVLAGGENATPERIAEVRAELGLDQPLLVQYWDWLRHALVLDFGDSLVDQRPVIGTIQDRFPVTLTLAFAAIAFGVIVGGLAGFVAGKRPGSTRDRVATVGSSIGMAVPNFWLGMLLISAFSLQLGWLPPGGLPLFAEDPAGWSQSLVLPAIALGMLPAAIIMRQLRASLVDVMGSHYVRTAWGKGGGVTRVVGKHALKNAAMPTVTVLGLTMGSLIGGSVLVEQIFSIPGLGTRLLQAVLDSDLPMIQGIVVFFALIQVVLMLLVDIAYSFLNPKVRTS